MSYPTIAINNSTGSDTLASGAGPATALTGSGASTAAGTTVDLSADSPDLSGVATDGTAVIWAGSSSGRQFAKITGVNNTTKVVTVSQSFANTESGRNWAIGGKRATINNTTSRRLFNADQDADWVISLEYTGTDYVISGSSIDVSNGPIVKGVPSGLNLPVIDIQSNIIGFAFDNYTYIRFCDLQIISTAGTKTNVYALYGGAYNNSLMRRVILGSWDNSKRILCGFRRDWDYAYTQAWEQVSVINCISHGVNWNHANWYMRGCIVEGNGGDGVAGGGWGVATSILEDSIFVNNTGVGFVSVISHVYARNCTFSYNGSHGLYAENNGNAYDLQLLSCDFSHNTGYGIATGSSAAWGNSGNVISFRNNFSSNTSGHKQYALPLEIEETNIDPVYANRSSHDWTIAAALCGSSYTQTANLIGEYSKRDIGAVQHQDSGGSSGPVGRNVVIQNIGTY